MRTMAGTAVAGGVAVFALVLAATVLSVTFATRGAMATNRPIVEVLHYVGAKDGFIAGQFQRHFLMLGLKGGAIGGGAAIVLVRRCRKRLTPGSPGQPGGDEAAALFGTFSIGVPGYLAILTQIVLMALVTALPRARPLTAPWRLSTEADNQHQLAAEISAMIAHRSDAERGRRNEILARGTRAAMLSLRLRRHHAAPQVGCRQIRLALRHRARSWLRRLRLAWCRTRRSCSTAMPTASWC